MTDKIPETQILSIAKEAARILAKRSAPLLVILLILLVGALTAGALAISDNYSNTNRIQETRLEACLDQDIRHANTINALNADLQGILKQTPPARRATVRVSLEASKTFTVGLIDQLAPYIPNCAVHIGQNPS